MIQTPSKYRFVFPTLVVLMVLIFLFGFDSAFAQTEEITETTKRTPRSLLFKDIFYIRFLINTVSVLILVMLVYLPIHRKKDYFFTFLVLNFLVFIITYLVSRTSAFSGVGAGLGLLAFFTLLRLRTATISMKDMTYLFIVLTIAIVNASMSAPDVEIIALNVAIIVLTFALDKEWLSKSIHSREMTLDSLENVVPEQMNKLVADLKSKTGLDIQRVKVISVDMVKHRAVVEIFHY